MCLFLSHNLNPIKRGSSGHNTCWWFEVCMQTTYFRRERNSFFKSHRTEWDVERRGLWQDSRVIPGAWHQWIGQVWKGLTLNCPWPKGRGTGEIFLAFQWFSTTGIEKYKVFDPLAFGSVADHLPTFNVSGSSTLILDKYIWSKKSSQQNSCQTEKPFSFTDSYSKVTLPLIFFNICFAHPSLEYIMYVKCTCLGDCPLNIPKRH